MVLPLMRAGACVFDVWVGWRLSSAIHSALTHVDWLVWSATHMLPLLPYYSLHRHRNLNLHNHRLVVSRLAIARVRCSRPASAAWRT